MRIPASSAWLPLTVMLELALLSRPFGGSRRSRLTFFSLRFGRGFLLWPGLGLSSSSSPACCLPRSALSCRALRLQGFHALPGLHTGPASARFSRDVAPVTFDLALTLHRISLMQ